MNFERARAIADAVLMEGYTLYPYRASAPKNRFRWTFGVLAPRTWSEAGGCEPWWMQTQFLVAGTPSTIAGRLRFFQIERWQRGDSPPWDEGVLRTVDFEIGDGITSVPFHFDGMQVANERGRCEIKGELVLAREVMLTPQPLTLVTVRVENQTAWREPHASRDQAMVAAFASTHLLVGVKNGILLSATDPPAWAQAEAEQCSNVGAHPVLVGSPGSADMLIAAPFIMQDYPQVAPESVGDFCDATEIDELLVLRTRTMTEAEKREARATDPRSAAIIDRAETMEDAVMARMHGAPRDLRAGEMVPVQKTPEAGSKVRLLAPKRRTDAQDLLYAGHIATVVEIREDVDGTTFVGVTIDDDPAAELHTWYGRCHYYRLDEVEAVSGEHI